MAEEYIELLQLPVRAYPDAVHLAFATVHELDYLLTWNLAHIANPHHIRKLTELNLRKHRHTPLIGTPEIFFELRE